jgi:uncharacterized protein YndB with AHSA1/START domain
MTPPSDPNKVVIRRRLRASPEELFDAWTDAEGMRAWMCPGQILSVEVRMEAHVGGALLVVMRDANRTYEHRGDQQPTVVTVEFLPINESDTELVLTHERFPREEVSEQYRGGWGQILDRLDRYLRSGKQM